MPDPTPTPGRVASRSTIEIDGKNWVVWRRPIEGNPKTLEVSFDGETFHALAVDSYLSAKKAGKLIEAGSVSEVEGLPEDAAAGMLELVRLIAALRPGEELRVVHTGVALAITKNKLVATLRPSVFEDIGIKAADEEDL